jgi:iron(III) transport system substrate-binding protein
MKRTKSIAVVLAAAATAFALAACSSQTTPPAASGSSEAAGDSELVTAAKAEGSLVVYTAQALGSTQPAADAFEAKYGIPVELVFLSTTPLLERFSAEEEAEATAADVIIATNLHVPADSKFIPDGWLTPVEDAGLPEIESGDFPSDFVNGSTATLMYLPWLIGYNTDRVKDAPTSFEDFADPAYKDQILSVDPTVSVAFIEIWDRVQETYGIKTLEGIAGNNPRYLDTAPAAAEALAAGEGMLTGPTTLSSLQAVMDAGAPVDYVVPDVTVGIQIEAGLTAHAPNPNAAKLFLDFLLSPEGNGSLVPEGRPDIWVRNPDLDSEYLAGLAAAPDAADRKAEILAALGR